MDGEDVKHGEKKVRKPLIYPRVDLVHAAYKTLVDAKPFGTLENVKDSTVLAAIQVVLDRSHPKKQENSPSNFAYISVDLSAYREEDSVPDAPPIYRIPPPASGISA